MLKDDFNDFGFTAVDEQELEAVQIKNENQLKLEEENTNLSTNLAECQKRLDALFSAVQPLLSNLKANPEKDYIYWPERGKKVDAFGARLKSIYEGKS